MFDDLAAYYSENAVTPFVEYRDQSRDGVAGRSRDIRIALNVATALFHLREHLPPATPLSRTETERACADYALLGDIANAAKHRILTSPTPHGAPFVQSATSIGEQLWSIEYEDEGGTYRHVEKVVVVKLSDGSERSLLQVLTNVLTFWEHHLNDLGVISTRRDFRYDDPLRFRERPDCNPQINFELVAGDRFHQTFRMFRFDSKTRRTEVVDLTGADAVFTIRKPQYSVDLSIQHDATGQIFTTSVALTDADHDALAEMSDDNAKQAYLSRLPAAQDALRRLVAEAHLTSADHEAPAAKESDA